MERIVCSVEARERASQKLCFPLAAYSFAFLTLMAALGILFSTSSLFAQHRSAGRAAVGRVSFASSRYHYFPGFHRSRTFVSVGFGVGHFWPYYAGWYGPSYGYYYGPSYYYWPVPYYVYGAPLRYGGRYRVQRWDRGYDYRPHARDSRAENTAWVRLDVEPRDAKVYLDGQYVGKAEEFAVGKKLLPVSVGGHGVELVAEGHQTLRVDFQVSALQTLEIQRKLEPIESGKRAPAPLGVKPALPKSEAAAEQAATPVQVTASNLRESEILAESKAQGRVVLQLASEGASVYLDQKWVGISKREEPQLIIEAVASGRHTLEIFKAGYKPFALIIEVIANETTQLHVELHKLETQASKGE